MSKSKKLPEWDLSEYYKGIDDPQIQKDLDLFDKKAKDFVKKYKGKVRDLEAAEFLKLFKAKEEMRRISSKLGGFAYLNSVTNMLDSKGTALYQRVEETLTNSGKDLVFFSIEFNKLSNKRIEELLQDKKLKAYAPFINRVRKFKKYELTEEVEKTLMEKEITSGSAWVRFYEESMARLEYVVDGKKYNDAEISRLLTDVNPKIRAKAGKEMNRVTKENSFMIGYAYNMIMKDKAIDDENGSHAGTMITFANRIARAVKDAGYENVAIDTFAYRYTRKAPTKVVPDDNVIVRLCTIECCFAHPIADTTCSLNYDFMTDLTAWGKICNRIYIWDYATNYAHTLGIFPDFGVLQKNIKTFRENNVVGIYEEGNYYMDACDGEFGELRAYLLAKLMQNPFIDFNNYMDELTGK